MSQPNIIDYVRNPILQIIEFKLMLMTICFSLGNRHTKNNFIVHDSIYLDKTFIDI